MSLRFKKKKEKKKIKARPEERPWSVCPGSRTQLKGEAEAPTRLVPPGVPPAHRVPVGLAHRTDATVLGDTCPCGVHCLHPLLRTSLHSPRSYPYICTDTENLQVNECTLAVTAISLPTAASVLSALSQWRAGDTLCITRGLTQGRRSPPVCRTVWMALQSWLFVKGNKLTRYKELFFLYKRWKVKISFKIRSSGAVFPPSRSAVQKNRTFIPFSRKLRGG